MDFGAEQEKNEEKFKTPCERCSSCENYFSKRRIKVHLKKCEAAKERVHPWSRIEKRVKNNIYICPCGYKNRKSRFEKHLNKCKFNHGTIDPINSAKETVKVEEEHLSSKTNNQEENERKELTKDSFYWALNQINYACWCLGQMVELIFYSHESKRENNVNSSLC